MLLMKILTTIYWMILGVLLLLVLFLLIPMVPLNNNYKILSVQSDSMSPTIGMGSAIVVKPVRNYRINDVITFGANNKVSLPKTHRIVDIRVTNGQQFFITKGDANQVPDLSGTAEQAVIGRVLLTIPFLGYFVAGIKRPIGFLVVFVIPCLVIIINEITKIKRELVKVPHPMCGLTHIGCGTKQTVNKFKNGK